MEILFFLREPKFPCIIFSNNNVFAAMKCSDLIPILDEISHGRVDVYDVDGKQCVYDPGKRVISPILGRKISKKALLERTFISTNLMNKDYPSRSKNLGNILYPTLFHALANFIKSQGEL
jgi:hypothetical protein